MRVIVAPELLLNVWVVATACLASDAAAESADSRRTRNPQCVRPT